MHNFNKYIVVLSILLFPSSSLIAKEFKFQDIPIQESGRIKPLDTYARNQLIRFSGRSSFHDQSATDWLVNLINDSLASHNKIFYINHPEVEKIFLDSLALNKSHRYSIDDLEKGYEYHDRFIRPKKEDKRN